MPNAKGVASLAIVLIIAFAAGVTAILLSKKDDSMVEELSETVIENQLDLPKGSVDLTPHSPE